MIAMPQFPKFDRSFDNLKRLGFIDTDSGAWDFSTNQRKVRCGRCGGSLPPGDGKPYNQFRADGYHATTKYLCKTCAPAVAAQGRAEPEKQVTPTEKP